MTRDEAVTRARGLVGVRFRPQGRDPAIGLDCVGVVARVYSLDQVRADYRLRFADAEALRREFLYEDFHEVAPTQAGPGDMLVVRAGQGQVHVVALVPGGYVHADAGMRRVVEVPGAVAWPVISAWRGWEG